MVPTVWGWSQKNSEVIFETEDELNLQEMGNIQAYKNHPEMKIAISEYGAGASIYHQQDSLVQTVPGSG